MRCPRCHGETGHAAIRCADCGAPLALGADEPARALDRPLDLDRRGPEAARPGLSPASADDLATTGSAALLAVPPPGVDLELRRAGRLPRVLAWLVDGVPFGLAALGLVWGLSADAPALVAQLLAVVALASFAYQTLAHALLGATLGKRLLGLRWWARTASARGPAGARCGRRRRWQAWPCSASARSSPSSR
jgi:hypothetical protein